MPDTCGIIAEFNPFHNGHKALITAAQNAGAKNVVAVMSGNFVQRGAPAVTDKRVRVHAALENGVDIVIELPLPASVATAQRFARAAVFLLKATGCVDMLAFGSECGDIGALTALAKAVDEDSVTGIMRGLLKSGVTFAKARELAVAEIYGENLAGQLAQPNNILGVEYLRQLALQDFMIPAVTIPRVGVQHHDENAVGEYASASYIRENAGDFSVVTRYVPERAAQIYAQALDDGLFPANPEKLETAILAHLRRMSFSEFSSLPDLSEGLEHRLYACIRKAKTLEELQTALKTKRYTMARVRRLVLSAFLGITQKDQSLPPPYIRVLGFTGNGQALLSRMKKSCRLPLDTSLARLREQNTVCEHFAALEELATDLYSLCLPSPPACGYEYTASGIYL